MKTLMFRGKFRGCLLMDELLDVFPEWVTGTTMEDRICARVQADAVANSSGSTIIQISSVYYLNAGSYLELRVEQNSGGDLNVQSNAQYSPEFAAQRIG